MTNMNMNRKQRRAIDAVQRKSQKEIESVMFVPKAEGGNPLVRSESKTGINPNRGKK